MPNPTVTQIKWQPGYWIDFSHPGGAVRDALGIIIAEGLYITNADFAYLKTKYAAKRPKQDDPK